MLKFDTTIFISGNKRRSGFRIASEKISLYLVFMFFIALTFLGRKIPFFWDASVYSQISHFYFENNFSSFILPNDLDPAGSPWIYWVYMAAMWKLFGKTLLVSHLAMLPFLIGITWEYYKLAKRFLSANWVAIAMMFLLVEPTFITQSIIMALDVPTAYFYLLALNSIVDKNKYLFSSSVCFLVLSSPRGMILIVSMFITHFFFCKWNKERKFIKEIIFYLPAVLLFSAWVCYHYYRKGWFLFSPSEIYSGVHKLLSFPMMFRRFIYILWSVLDFGRVVIWAFIFFGIIFIKIKNKKADHLHFLILSLLCPLLVLVMATIPFSIPLGHRYFLILFFLSPIVMLYIASCVFSAKKYIYALAIVCNIALVSGNFWIYGGGFSNGWDASLKVLPYFGLKNQMIQFVKEEKINPMEVGTKFPLYHDSKYSDLDAESFHFTDMAENPITDYKYILLSNVSNQFTVQEKKELNSEWKMIKEYTGGEIYLKLFLNPLMK